MRIKKKRAPFFGGWQELMTLAWPLIISSSSFAVLNFCDRLFLSWYNEDAFRASLPAGVLFFTLVCGFMAVAGFANTFVAQMWGANDREGCAKATAQSILFSGLSFFLLLLLVPVGLQLLRLSGHAPNVLLMEERYFRILMWSGSGMVLSSAIGSFFSGRGKTFIIMGCNIAANAVNILLNYLLVFGKGGFPEMGIDGAGWASVIGAWISPLILVAFYFSKHNRREFNTLKMLRYNSVLFRRLIRFGVPAGVEWFLDVAAFTIFVLVLGRIGEIAHIASNIALSINLIAFMPMIGLGMAASILVGQYLGRDDSKNAQRIGWLAFRIGLSYVALIGITFLLFPIFYAKAFTGHLSSSVSLNELMHTVRILLAILAFWGFADATALTLSGALKGAGDTHFVMRFRLIVSWGILVPAQFLIVVVLKKGVFASWACTLFYITILAIGFILRFRSNRWKQIDLLDRKNRQKTIIPYEV